MSEMEESWQAREVRIAQAVKDSKKNGAAHLDAMPLYVEEVRGKRFRSLRDGKDWLVSTVDNNKNVDFVSPDGKETDFTGGKELGEFVLRPSEKSDAATVNRHNKDIRKMTYPAQRGHS